jgi:[acyl-carrier-protein] S-malonyltransferase
MRTSVAQPAIVATSLAAAAYLQELIGGPPTCITAGHSVGELAAMCWAGALDVETALRLVYERGQLMERDSASVDGTMVAVLGLTRAQLEPICQDASTSGDGTAQVANCNAPGQVALSGERAAIERASTAAVAAGARRVLPLSVGGPFHSVYMQAAAQAFKNTVDAAHIEQPRVPVILNTSAIASADPRVLREELSAQITRPVLWEDSVNTLAAMGCDTFLELGAGKVLAGLVRRTLPEATVLSAGSPETIREAAQLFVTSETAV